MARLNDTSVTEAVNAGIDQILNAALTINDAGERLKCMTSSAALLLELAKRGYSASDVKRSFKRSEVEIRRAAQTKGQP